ncbi:hypothetical protein SBRY_40387 [Actinacidiphila bryophytorum]|uniref:Uncharacterized protein n=1 Tax=Actinacidiphila bryophytorum TaxID=1436133 RepID=A0A9W4H2L6_9ACTN|nr:hypothetical protein SBRY_40387 [Actinacidiphila bryophytorum]
MVPQPLGALGLGGGAPRRALPRPGAGERLREQHPRDPVQGPGAGPAGERADAVRTGRGAADDRHVRLRRVAERGFHRAHQIRRPVRRVARGHLLPDVGPRTARGDRPYGDGGADHQDPGGRQPDDARLRAHRPLRGAVRHPGDLRHGRGRGRGARAVRVERAPPGQDRGDAQGGRPCALVRRRPRHVLLAHPERLRRRRLRGGRLRRLPLTLLRRGTRLRRPVGDRYPEAAPLDGRPGPGPAADVGRGRPAAGIPTGARGVGLAQAPLRLRGDGRRDVAGVRDAGRSAAGHLLRQCADQARPAARHQPGPPLPAQLARERSGLRSRARQRGRRGRRLCARLRPQPGPRRRRPGRARGAGLHRAPAGPYPPAAARAAGLPRQLGARGPCVT